MVPLMTPWRVPSLHRIVAQMRDQPQNIAFADLQKVCRTFFGDPRQIGTSHMVFRVPWQGDPRVNIQNDHGKAKQYQVRQVLRAIDRLEGEES